MMRLLFFCLFLALCSCKTDHPEVDYIDIPRMLDSDTSYSLTSFTSDINYIPLQSSDENYIGRIEYIICENNFILIHDKKSNGLLQFDGKGNYIKVFIKKGRGPNEYFDIGAMDANQNREILLLRNGQHIDIWTFSGELINSIKLDATPKTAKWLNDETIVLFYSYPRYFQNNGYEIIIVDRQGKIVKKALKRTIENVKRGRGGRIKCGINNGELYYWSHQSDTVYTITESLDVYPRYIFAHDDRHIPVEKYRLKGFQPILERQYTVESYLEWGEYIFTSIAYNYNWVRGVLDKKQNRYVNCVQNPSKWNSSGIYNNIDGGSPFWPLKSSSYGELIGIIDPLKLVDSYEHSKATNEKVNKAKQEYLSDIISSITLYSNPIIVTVND